jgi:GNAT superfamily N-acetyltransferase
MDFAFRQASPGDFDYCAKLYFAAMEATIGELKIDMQRHIADFRERWDVGETRIITCDGADGGWLQAAVEGDALFLKQLFVAAPLQRRGIGTQAVHRLIDEAARAGRAVTLGVVKTNPALRLYRRLGFAITHEDERKFYMRRERDAASL